MDLTHSEVILSQLEKSPERVQLYHGELETMIAALTEDIYRLLLTGADNDRKMRLVALEYRARLCWSGFASGT